MGTDTPFLRWLVLVFHARAYVRLPTREDPPARKAKQIWRRSALFAKGYLAHFEKKFVFTQDCITKKVLSYFEIWKKSAPELNARVLGTSGHWCCDRSCLDRVPRKYQPVQEVSR